MKSFSIITGLLSLALFAGTIDARKYNGKELETKPNFWVYNDDVRLSKDNNLQVKESGKKSSFWIYNDEESNPIKEKSTGKKLDNIFWVYSDDIKQKDKEENLSTKDFDGKRSVSINEDEESKTKPNKYPVTKEIERNGFTMMKTSN